MKYRNGKSQIQIAREMGMDKSYVSNILNGKRRPPKNQVSNTLGIWDALVSWKIISDQPSKKGSK